MDSFPINIILNIHFPTKINIKKNCICLVHLINNFNFVLQILKLTSNICKKKKNV